MHRSNTVDGGKSSPPLKRNFKKKKIVTFKNFEIFKFQFVGFISLNFPRLMLKTASPGPIVSVATPCSWEYDDMKNTKNPPGGNYFFRVRYVVEMFFVGYRR